MTIDLKFGSKTNSRNVVWDLYAIVYLRLRSVQYNIFIMCLSACVLVAVIWETDYIFGEVRRSVS